MFQDRDLFGVGAFTLIFLALVAFSVFIGALVVQDGRLQEQCVKAGNSYVNGDCLVTNHDGDRD